MKILYFMWTTLAMILSVENNCLQTLSNDVGDLSALQQANFNNNQIHYIPPAIKGCQELRILGGFRKKDFQTNFVQRFSSKWPIFVTKRLNKIIRWIEHFKKWKTSSARIKELSRNKLQFLPNEISACEKINYLDLGPVPTIQSESLRDSLSADQAVSEFLTFIVI